MSALLLLRTTNSMGHQIRISFPMQRYTQTHLHNHMWLKKNQRQDKLFEYWFIQYCSILTWHNNTFHRSLMVFDWFPIIWQTAGLTAWEFASIYTSNLNFYLTLPPEFMTCLLFTDISSEKKQNFLFHFFIVENKFFICSFLVYDFC